MMSMLRDRVFGPKPGKSMIDINSEEQTVDEIGDSESAEVVKSVNDVTDDFDINDLIGDQRDEVPDNWNDDWEAFEEIISDEVRKKYLEVNPKNKCINGVVTKLMGNNEILIEDNNKTKRIQFDSCYITDIIVGDLIKVETTEDNKVVVKPFKYKVFNGTITDCKSRNRFMFAKHAFMRKTRSTDHLKDGNFVKCVVIETQNRSLIWRAFPFKYIYELIAEENELMVSKSGLEITTDISFGFMRYKTSKTILIWIKNTSEKPQILLSVDNELVDNQIYFHAFFDKDCNSNVSEPPFLLDANSKASIELTCDAKILGQNNELLSFKFNGFEIRRNVSVKVIESINPLSVRDITCDQNEYERRLFGTNSVVINGERPWNLNKHNTIRKIRTYEVPNDLWESFEKNIPLHQLFPELKQKVDKINYRKRMHALIYAEECANTLAIRKYNRSDVSLRSETQFIAIKVMGLAEGRPSLIIGDRVKVLNENKSTDEKSVIYSGYIHELRKDEILVKFDKEFHNEFSGGLFKVMFRLNRTVIRRRHHAIDQTLLMSHQLLFPTIIEVKPHLMKCELKDIEWFNTSLNARQKLAVIGALRGECRPMPYIIFGPPGTGKTVTIVESVLQVFKNLKKSRVIACTADNSSADLITRSLLESKLVTEDDLVRLASFSHFKSIPKVIECVSVTPNHRLKDWLYHRIIVTTTSQAGTFFTYPMNVKHFTHVFIDEAAQVTEPESNIPISLAAIGDGVVVLAGDHKQLGPFVQSLDAKKGGLEYSFMERLMNGYEPYKAVSSGKLDSRFVVKLVDNYRSDEQIMRIPSKLFYNNELKFKTETDYNLIGRLKLNSAVSFIGVCGEERQAPETPSWYNSEEITKVCSLLERLYRVGVKSEEIGVITPYREQMIKVRLHIKAMGLGPFATQCKVGTIEEFQGLEKRVIIVSMVRSTEKNIMHDKKYNLGFVFNPKRFNVAISRAKSLLIVVGNPSLLSLDKNWEEFIEYCNEKKSCYGCPFDHYNRQILRPLTN